VNELVDIAVSELMQFPKQVLCKVLGIGRSSYYYCAGERPEGRLAKENKILKQEVTRIYHEQDGVYGAPKIRQELLKLELPFKVSEKRVQRIMKRLGLHSVVIKKFRPTKTNAVYNEGKNLLNRDFSTTKMNEKWVSDITYVHTLDHGWCYLASIMDLSTVKIIGWSFSKTMDTSIVVAALDQAMKTQNPGKGLILHSDRGSQYTSHEYRSKLAKHGIRQSFSAKGCPYDNAPIESFHALLKKEFVYRTIFKSFEDAQARLFQYIEGRYNRSRIHSAIGYRTPQEMENHLSSAA
jgi:transposase InsO family protein